MRQTDIRAWLAEYQRGNVMHPYTCPRDHAEHICLIPGMEGWFCAAQDCDYTQEYGELEEAQAKATRFFFRGGM